MKEPVPFWSDDYKPEPVDNEKELDALLDKEDID